MLVIAHYMLIHAILPIVICYLTFYQFLEDRELKNSLCSFNKYCSVLHPLIISKY